MIKLMTNDNINTSLKIAIILININVTQASIPERKDFLSYTKVLHL